MCLVKTQGLQCAHVISRSNLHLRFNELNALCLCAGCHLKWHHEPLWAVTWFQKTFPVEYKYLMEEKNIIGDHIDYETIISVLKIELAH